MSFLADNGTLYVSQYPGSCTKTQTPFDVASSPGSSVTGLKIVLADTSKCVVIANVLNLSDIVLTYI